MTTTTAYDTFKDQRAKLIDSVLSQLGPEALADPNLPDILGRLIDQRLGPAPTPVGATPPPGAPPDTTPADGGFADLIGIGDTAAKDLNQTQMSPGVVDYDDTVTSDRILATADLYYLWVHERLGVFRVISQLQELFRAGSLRISSGPGAFGLYRFDRRAILRYRRAERMQAYRRVLGYGAGSAGANARPNPDFHPLFTHFVGETAKFWRDKRISEVIRERATDPTFGSIAIVRRAALDLRNNVKNSSYGYANVMRIETGQALADAFRILDSPDVKAQFGAENAWDMIELVTWQYFHQSVAASAMNRMATAGRTMLQWLAEPFVLTTDRKVFEAKLYPIAEPSEEWISSEEGFRLTRPTPPPRNVYVPGAPPQGRRRDPVFARNQGLMPAAPVVG
jgi:hypothetical protein